MCRRDPPSDLADLGLAVVREPGLEEATGALQPDLGRHDVADVAAVDLGQAEHERLVGVGVAADDALDGLDEGAGRQDRVVTFVRPTDVRALARELDLEHVDCSHHRANPRRDRTERHAGPVVNREHRLDREALEQTVIDHALAATLVLLGRLEHEMDDAVEGVRPAEQLGGAEQHRGVAVVAARVHHTFVARSIA